MVARRPTHRVGPSDGPTNAATLGSEHRKSIAAPLYVLCVVSDRHIALGRMSGRVVEVQRWSASGIWTATKSEPSARRLARQSHVSVSADRRYLVAGIGGDIVVIDVPTEVVVYRHATSARSPVATHPRRNLCICQRESDQGELRETVRYEQRDVVIRDINERRVVAKLPCDARITSISICLTERSSPARQRSNHVVDGSGSRKGPPLKSTLKNSSATA